MKPIGLCTCCLLALSGIASAAESFEWASGEVAIGSSGSLSISQFDSDLGTLTQVEVLARCNATAWLELENTSETQDYYDSASEIAFDVSASMSGELFGETLTSATGSIERTYSGPEVLAGTTWEFALWAYDSAFDEGYQVYTDASDLALFTGTGTISLLMSSSGSTDIDPPADLPSYVEASSGHVMCGNRGYVHLYSSS